MEKILTIMPRGPMGIAREGFPFIGLGLVLTALGLWLFWPSALCFAALTGFILYFFRDPERTPPAGSGWLLSPADGRVLKVEKLPGNSLYPEPHFKVSIFMSALNVHVNRIPCDGVIREIKYHPGKFFVASLDKASVHNERNTVILETPQQQKVAFTQIAGLVARRIVCYLKPLDSVRQGERYGMIRFGSRMEVCLPDSWRIVVVPGQKVRGVQTALAQVGPIGEAK